MIQPLPSSRCLWKTPSESDDDDDENDTGDSLPKEGLETYDSVLSTFLATPPPPKSLSTLCSNSLVVGQEFALTCLFWARHRVTVWEEELRQSSHHNNGTEYREEQQAELQERMVQSQIMALIALVIIAIFSNSSAAPPQPQPRAVKVQQRTTDAVLLAVLLRLLSSVLRSLTASFSADTVESLTVAGMVIHWLTCDYSYANATASRITGSKNNTNSKRDKDKSDKGKSVSSSTQQKGLDPKFVPASSKRPVFQGGTVSLNAAFFSTTVLASRLSSNATVYIFVSSAVILFAFFPAARHAISHHPYRAMSK